MNNLAELKEGVSLLIDNNARVRALANKFLLPKETSEDTKDNLKMGNALAAVEVVCSLVNVFSALLTTNPVFTQIAITDLTFGLNSNSFWVRNTGHLMPLFIASINGISDYNLMALENEPRWSDLRAQGKNLWLEILPTIVFLIHGYPRMKECSIEIKKSFASILDG
ncbi:MAG: hypothetical protein ACREQ5_04290 [Candidatus Dormibacteria bacterium]